MHPEQYHPEEIESKEVQLSHWDEKRTFEVTEAGKVLLPVTMAPYRFADYMGVRNYTIGDTWLPALPAYAGKNVLQPIGCLRPAGGRRGGRTTPRRRRGRDNIAYAKNQRWVWL